MAFFKRMKEVSNDVKEIGVLENYVEEDVTAEIVAWLKHMRTKNVQYSHNMVNLNLFGNNLSMKHMEEIENQLKINRRY